MLSRTSLVVAALASVVAAIPCKAVTPTLPSTGTIASDLPAPASSLTLKRIAIGHGIQNYTCAAADASTTGATAGALAVLYDVTALYPGTPNTGLDQAAWDTLSTTVLFGQDIPLNLVDPSAAAPGTPEAPNALPEQAYAADTANPFPAQADLTISGLPTIPFLGHHYFDAASNPTFDLTAANLLASVGKTNVTNAPADANKGILATGAVQWLLLTNKQGLSRGVESVYRVVTAGGVSQDCATAGVGAGSVPYTAFYWFLG